MATTLPQLETLFTSIGWKYKKKQDSDNATEGYLYAGFPTQKYKDADGDPYVSVLFYVQEQGELIKIIIPKLYSCINPLHRRAFFEVAVRKTFEKKLCFFDYDHRDGEIRMVVDLPLEDASVTEKQIKRIVTALISHVDNNDADVRAAVEEGKLPFLDYKADLNHEISKLSSDQQLELLVEIKRRGQAGGQ